MIVITGAAGFIGSCLISKLNELGEEDIVIVDDFSRTDRTRNYRDKKYLTEVNRAEFISWLDVNGDGCEFIFHIGARTDTTEFDSSIFDELNLNYTKAIWTFCAENEVPLVYASSAATYGLGEHGYKDDHDIVTKLKPLNPYGDSKNDFDIWALEQSKAPPFWAGLKFFNVYGPNEYHKGRMASVIFHAFNQIKANGKMNLFRSHNPDYKDGEQLRDFIYVKDLIEVCVFFLEHQKKSGLYNLGTGKAETFLELVESTFAALSIPADIGFIDTPEDIRDKYQYYTQADMSKLRSAGYDKPFMTLREGVKDYVTKFLAKDEVY
jgi:ADP-L-glycero-D-manno-heptose 6-epimerase